MKLAIVVPGRLESTRFPRKLLHKIGELPLIIHTANRIRAQVPDIPLFFAVDDPSLLEVLDQNGYQAMMTRRDHPSGTDRLAEANARIGAEHIINVQADEPMVTRAQIETLGELIQQPDVDLATLAHRFERSEDFNNPNQVKVVIGQQQQALYFSRSPIPFFRDQGASIDDQWLNDHPVYRHLGLYAYTARFLSAYRELKPTYLEQIEKLEQLRALENGFRIAVGITQETSIGVDTLADAHLFDRYLKTR
jgi:3-deoxy-manno-octulosonate cytidylyltransferase (CMP-KDO synthetase)